MSQIQRQGNSDDNPTSRTHSASPVNSGRIPRDYLGPRSDMQASRTAGPRQPSPLQTSSLPQTYLRDDSSSPPRSSSNASPFQNPSPGTRVANATFPTPPSNAAQSSSRPPEMTSPQSSADMAGRPGDVNLSKSSGVAEPERSTNSSPKSTLSSLQSLPGDRPPQRMMPRTSSIDSAISSLSTVSQKSSFDAKALSAADISNLISTAGSAEAVIVHLLKEKHHAASQNAQLWKLVDKQRTLILGLNKDLERAYKEKDKYKKKLKELQDTVPPLPLSIEPKSTNQSSREPPETANGARETGSRPEPQKDQLPKALAAETSEETSEMTTGPGPAISIPSPGRKPPPAPLNLRQTDSPRTQDADADADDSGSDYGEVQEEPSGTERGRRKTREEDDRDREEALMKETGKYGSVEASKSGTTQSSQDTATASPVTVPRALASRSPPTAGGTGSLGSVLASRTGRPNNSMPKSPGLPMSPRPEDRPVGSPVPRMPRDMANPMASAMAAGYNASGLPVSPRAGNQPELSSQEDSAERSGSAVPSIDPAVNIDSPESMQLLPDRTIYQGLVSEEYPDLLLPPNALPLIQVRVSSSRLRPSRNSYILSKPLDEEPVFTLSIISRSETKELWRVEKVIASLPELDQQVRQVCSFSGKLPERAIFSGHSPAKVDARRAALNTYFGSLLDTPMDETAALIVCTFLSSDAIEPRDDEMSLLKGNTQVKPETNRGLDGKPWKEGYLTKRGKNFGGWKARYFVLHGPELKYFDSPSGPHMGTIRLVHAQIGKQSQNQNASSGIDEDSDNQYRHAFLVLEPKKKDSSALVRHVLCAESDEERDAWVDSLMEYVEGPASENEKNEKSVSGSSKSQPPAQGKQLPGSGSKSKMFSNNGDKRPGKGVDSSDPDAGGTVQGFSFDDTIAAEPPILGTTLDQAPKSPRLPSALSTDFTDKVQSMEAPLSPKMISGPTNGAVILDAEAWGNKATTATSTKEKKRSIWGFRKSSYDLASQAQASNDIAAANHNVQAERKEPVRPVFGIPLIEAVQYCSPQDVNVELPAVVYRCIEYLEAKGAATEEGIFRLSGSNVVIKALRERFNTEGDVDFLAGDQYYDIHAVASLFKQYLRELPTTVLTRELHLDFIRVLELSDRQKKVAAFNALVHRLPSPNLSLLCALSQFLIEIVNNSDVNKMTIRNVGIVFAPTLNIPAPVFSMFLTDYKAIFGRSSGPVPSTKELTVDRTLTPDDVRSPRHQMFSDIPTPSYKQTSFRGPGDPNSIADHSKTHHDTGFIPMQPTYDQSAYRHEMYNQQASASGQFSSLNGMLVPSSDDTRSAKSKRRESSMLYMEQNS